jgi:hypothetical protein
VLLQAERPQPWKDVRQRVPHRLLLPFYAIDWALAYLAYWLSRWSLFEALEYAGTLSILVGVVLWFSEADQRTQQRHYQAWQVINTAQGKGGNGGRIDALEQLSADGVSLTGVDVSRAYLQNVRLEKAELTRANFSAADMRGARLRGAMLEGAALVGTNLRGADLRGVDLENADFQVSDSTGANIAGANLKGANLHAADMGGIVGWESIRSIDGANIHGVQNPPTGFLEWALKHGAVQTPETEQ